MRYNFITIEGTIGAGKTTLASRISTEFNGKLILEQFEDNAFLPKFYEDQEKYAFPLEMSFMASRFQQLKEELSSPDLFSNFTISDYFFPKSLIFAQKTLPKDELALFTRFFNFISGSLPKPDLLVYLYLDVNRLQQNIRLRGRSYEQKIKDEYLESIQAGYFDYMRQQPGMRILILDVNELDFVHTESDYQRILKIIRAEHPIGIHRFTF